MRMTCPACGASADLDVFMEHEGARQVVRLALELPAGMSAAVMSYLGLFRPPKRQLTWSRVATLLGELLDAIKAGQIERKGRSWAAPQALWIAAIETVIAARDADKLRLPLKSHGYLFEVVVGLTDQKEAAAEQREEERRAYAMSEKRHAGGGASVASVLKRSEMPDETRQVFDQVLRRGGRKSKETTDGEG